MVHTVKIFLAGCNGGRKDILIEAMGEEMIIYMAGAVGGNLKPMWQRATQRMQEQDYVSAVDSAITEFLNEDLLGGSAYDGEIQRGVSEVHGNIGKGRFP